MSWQTYGLRESNQKSSREESREEQPPPPLPPCVHRRAPPRSPPPQPSTDQHMWWRMTHLFFYKGCVYVKLLKCIKMSSTLGGPPRLPWKITRWKYNFSAGEPGIWTEFCPSLFLPSFALSLFLSCPLFSCACSSSSLLLGSYSFLVFFSVCAHSTITVEHIVKVCGFTITLKYTPCWIK